jgi:broad specificity phosphatase PhoE
VETRILLIRHASAEADGRLCGSFDVPLSRAGREQIAALIERGARRRAPDALLTSPLRRARDVATALGRAWAMQPRAAAWAREIHCGELEGLPLEQIRRELPDIWARNEAQADESFGWPGGESYAAFRARVLRGVRGTARAYPGRRVAVVTHAGVVSQLLGAVHGRRASAWAPDRPRPLTATEITWSNGRPDTVLAFDDPDWY